NWFARDLKLKPSHLASLSGTLAAMGPGVPYAIAAKFAFPNRPAVALVGDGAMQMNGMAELITAAKYYGRWQDPRLVVLVLNNSDLNQVTWEQRAMEGDPKNPATQDIPGVRRRPAVRDRRRHGPGGAAAAAAHHRGAGARVHALAAGGRSPRARGDHRVVQAEDPRVPARPLMADARVERLDLFVQTVPTDAPESDGTMEWESTTIVLVEARGSGEVGL